MTGLPRANLRDTARVLGVVLAPMLARGVILRRPAVVALAERVDADRRAGAVLAALRDRYGGGPLLLRLPGRELALVLEDADVERLLAGSPHPFTPANREKRAALRHFQPAGVLISDEAHRAVRRPFNEAVLDHGAGVHHLHARFAAVVAEEMAPLRWGHTVLGWDGFAPAFWRVVRRVTLGDAARDDTAVTDLVAALRARANWVLVPPSRRRLRELAERLRGYVATAEPGSLAGLVRTLPAPHGTAAVGQMPHWLFAFDAAGIATFRALALLAGHPETLAAVRREAPDVAAGPGPLTRATLLESVRLWPTTLTILRDSVEETTWAGRRAAPGTAFAVMSSFFHRDAARLPWADRFAPETWLDGRAAATDALVPFSAGPAACPGQTLVLDVAGTVLATLAAGGVALDPPDRVGRGDLPRTLAHTTLRFRLG